MFIKLPNSSKIIDTDRVRYVYPHGYDDLYTVKYDVGSSFQPDNIEFFASIEDTNFLCEKMGVTHDV